MLLCQHPNTQLFEEINQNLSQNDRFANISISTQSNILASLYEGVTQGTLSLSKHPRNVSWCRLCMWLQGGIVSNHDLVTFAIFPSRLSVCLHSWECNLPPPQYTRTRIQVQLPQGNFSEMNRNSSLFSLRLKLFWILRNLTCNDPTRQLNQSVFFEANALL